MSPNIIIHIGDGKCGSSAIQNSLKAQNDELSLNHNILYHPISNNHFQYVSLIKTRMRNNVSSAIQSSKKNINEIEDIILNKTSYNYVLFSGESFFDQRPESVLSLLSNIIFKDTKIYIIAYVRDPVDHYLSKMQQRLKSNSKIKDPIHFRRDIYYSLISWQTHPRVFQMIVRPFRHNSLVKGEVVTDFSNILYKITGSEIELVPQKSNISMSAEQMIVLQDFRREHLSNCDENKSYYSNLLIKFFKDINNIEGMVKSKPLLNSWIACSIAENHKDIVQKLDQDFPSLNFFENASINPYNTRRFSNHQQKNDVRDILANFDENIINLFKYINPIFVNELSEDWFLERCNYLSKRGFCSSSITLYRQFVEKTPKDSSVRLTW